MPRPQFSLKTMSWVMGLVAAAAGVASHVARHQGEEFGMIPWLAIGGIVGGFVGLFVREPAAFMMFGIGAAFALGHLLRPSSARFSGTGKNGALFFVLIWHRFKRNHCPRVFQFDIASNAVPKTNGVTLCRTLSGCRDCDPRALPALPWADESRRFAATSRQAIANLLTRGHHSGCV
jgi:hypothetical protein